MHRLRLVRSVCAIYAHALNNGVHEVISVKLFRGCVIYENVFFYLQKRHRNDIRVYP